VYPIFVSPDPIYSVAGRLIFFLQFTKWRTQALSLIYVYIYTKPPQNQKFLVLPYPCSFFALQFSVVQNEALLGPSGLTSEHRYHPDGCLSGVFMLWIQPSRYGRCAHPRVLCESVSSVGYYQHHGSPKQIQREYSRSVVAGLLDYIFIRSYH
jgi:hypothetical protein